MDGLNAMVVGIGSLFVILYETQLTRQAQHASVMPYLTSRSAPTTRG